MSRGLGDVYKRQHPVSPVAMAISADIIINLVFIEVMNYLQSEYRIKFYGKVWQYGNLHIDGLRFRYGYHHLYVGVSRKRGEVGKLGHAGEFRVG